MNDRPGSLPRGTVTFLFTDIEGSTRLAEELGQAFPDVLAIHHDLLRTEVSRAGGVVVGTEGDAFFVVFGEASAAIGAAVAMQRVLRAQAWPRDVEVRVRMGLHTGAAVLGGDDYTGLDVTRAARIAAAAHGGQVLTSVATRQLTEADVGPAIRFVDLGEYRLKDLSRPERLQQVVADGLDDRFPAPRTKTVTLDLPVPLTSFVGRNDERARARRALDEGVRLLTLTGPGGTGKTRLAVQVAADVGERFADGVQFVDLSMTADPAMVPAAVARALRLIERPGGTPADLLADHLRERTLLLVLDNFEQVIDAAPLVPGLLRAAPGLTVIATSRGPLRVSGEHEFAVPPLGLPTDHAHIADATEVGPDPAQHRPLSATQAARSPAVELFVDRATAARSDFRLTDDNAATVAAICAELDGLPLAIELAAARVRLLPPEMILTRLGHSLDLLDRGGRDLPARQQTLRGAIEWSHDLLDPATRRLFARLAVFAGGARLDEIDAVCGSASDLGTDILVGLEDLVDQSLIQRTEVDRDPRYAMLRIVHEFAAERLATSDDAETIRRRHAETYLAIAENAAPELVGSDQRRWLDLLEHEHDNLRSAIDWAVTTDQTDLALRLVTAPWRFWQMRGHLVEARDRIGAAIAMADAAAHPASLARALGAAGGIAYWLGDHPASSRFYRRALAIARDTDDPALLAGALSDAALAEADIHDPASLAAAAERGLRLLDESLSIYRELGDRRGEAGVLWTIGTAYSYIGDLAESARYLTDSAAVAEASGDLFHASWATYMLGGIASRTGDVASAAVYTRDALAMFSSVRDLTGMMLSLVEVGYALDAAGDIIDGLKLAGAAAAFERGHGGEYLSTVRDIAARSDPQALVGNDPAFAAAWADGEALSLDEAVALALSLVDEGRSRSDP